MRKVLCALLLIGACDSSSTEPDLVPQRLNVREGIVRLLYEDSAQLTAELRAADGQLLGDDDDITWLTRDAGIASVSADGVVRGNAFGWAVVVAQHGELRDSLWVSVGPRYKSVEVGSDIACGITLNDELHCWGGDRPMSFLGVAASNTPRFFAHNVQRVALGEEHGCRMMLDGAVWCWGRDRYGQLGDGEASVFINSGTQVELPVSLLTLNTSLYHTCGVTAVDDVYCWGTNDVGELGIWPDPDGYSPRCNYRCREAPVQVAGVKLRSVSAGLERTCGVDANGVAHCWGGNMYGQLGVGTPGDTLLPTPVNTTLRFKSINAHGHFVTCGITTSDELYCWGNQPFTATPARVGAQLNFKAVAFAGDKICALTVAGRLHCGATGEELTPVGEEITFTQLAAMWWLTCALSESGGIYCMGPGYTGTGGPGRLFPVMIAPPGPVPQLDFQ